MLHGGSACISYCIVLECGQGLHNCVCYGDFSCSCGTLHPGRHLQLQCQEHPGLLCSRLDWRIADPIEDSIYSVGVGIGIGIGIAICGGIVIVIVIAIGGSGIGGGGIGGGGMGTRTDTGGTGTGTGTG